MSGPGLLRATGAWLVLAELYARRRSWRGLSWMAGAPDAALWGLALGLALPRRPRLWAALAAAPLALLAQAALGSLRNRRLDPLRRLDVGEHPDRTIARVDVPMPEGDGAGGATMPALYIVPRGGARAAACVLHGSGCDKTYYAWRLADALVSRGVAALLVDLDGHGESPRVQAYPAMLADAGRGVGWLRERHASVGLVGVSLGGCLAARAAADGLALDALALLETPPWLSYTRDDMVREALGLTEPFLLDLFGESTALNLAATVYDLVAVQGGPRIRCTVGTVELIAALDLLGALPAISAPLLMIYGGRDSIVRADQAERARLAAPPQAQFEVVPEACHLSLTLHPGALARLGSWLAAELGAGA